MALPYKRQAMISENGGSASRNHRARSERRRSYRSPKNVEEATVDRYNRGLMIVARILVAIVFILNGFGIINQAIPAKEMMERGVPPAIVPLFMIAGRLLEIVAGFGLALGLFPRWCALALFVFLLPATFVSHSFWLAAGTPLFQGQLINFSKNVAIWGGLIFIAGTSNQASAANLVKSMPAKSEPVARQSKSA
jgi:putative oxidoreductase